MTGRDPEATWVLDGEDRAKLVPPLDDSPTYEWLRNRDDWFEELPTLGELADEPSDS